MSEAIWKILIGNTTIYEYKTVTIRDAIRERVYLETGTLTLDISSKHSIVCLEPLVFGIWTEKEQLASFPPKEKYRIYFTDKVSDNDKDLKINAVAILELNLLEKIGEQDGALILLRVIKARIYHIDPIRTHILFRKFFSKPWYSFAIYKYLRSQPIAIPEGSEWYPSGREDHFNIFPMDLLGGIGQGTKFIFGLKHANVSLSHIIKEGKLVVSEASSEYKDAIHKNGEHHNAAPSSPESLPFRLNRSEQLGFLVSPVYGWKAIKRSGSCKQGI